jgi:hypothetical protein
MMNVQKDHLKFLTRFKNNQIHEKWDNYCDKLQYFVVVGGKKSKAIPVTGRGGL